MNKYLMILAVTLTFLPKISHAQGLLPECFSEAVSAAEEYAQGSFEEVSLSSVEQLDETQAIQFLVTFLTKSKGNEGKAGYKVEFAYACSDPKVAPIAINKSLSASCANPKPCGACPPYSCK